ncbi:MAG TPA: DUF4032 domain-containing protein [Nocardioidaceae bacterium]|nr:DUF4032 domain-containing protein [Nocardioidaceae bacterium]
MALRIAATRPDPALLSLPWHLSLEDWDDEHLVSLPRGLSRHVVRFVRLGDHVYAVKETREPIALGEYRLLRDLRRLRLPAVEPVGVVTGRTSAEGEPIEPALVTRHLSYSQPYRQLFSHQMRAETVERLLDALVVLLTRVHLSGFFWGDVSLSNTLFRRSAGAFAAYLVDAETGELHPALSPGQRAHDLDIATTNVFGELLDLQAGGVLDHHLNPADTARSLAQRYASLWEELTAAEQFNTAEMWRIEQRIRRLNDLGFDVDELDIVTDWDGASVRIQPQVVEAGHHSRRLMHLTGLDVEDNQARRLLNDLDAYRAANDLQREDEAIVAHRWVTDIFEPIVGLVPLELRGDLEPAEIFHEILEHRWYLSEQAGREVEIFDVARSYAATVLTARQAEAGLAQSPVAGSG